MHQSEQSLNGPARARSIRGVRWMVVSLVLVVAGGAGCSGDDDDSVAEDTPAEVPTDVPVGTPAELPGVLEYDETDQDHVNEPVDYALSPPVGGNHFQVWQNCGFYTEPVLDEQAVHSLEHGAVWVTYNPELVDADDLTELAEVAGAQTHVLVSPYDHEAPMILTAWNRQQILETIDGEAVADFILQYQEGPQTPEPGAPCEGGAGEPED